MGILMAQQDSIRNTQLLIALNAFAVLLLLAFSSSWTATVAAGCMMAVLLYVLGPEAVARVTQPAAGAAGVATVRGVEQPLLRASRAVDTSGGVSAVLVCLHGVLTCCQLHCADDKAQQANSAAANLFWRSR